MKQIKFDEGDEVYARWPGSVLYFKAKVLSYDSDTNECKVHFLNEDSDESNPGDNIFEVPVKDCKSPFYFKTTPKKKRRSFSSKSPSKRRRSRSPARRKVSERNASSSRQESPSPTRSPDVLRSRKPRSPSRPVMTTKVTKSSTSTTNFSVDLKRVSSEISSKGLLKESYSSVEDNTSVTEEETVLTRRTRNPIGLSAETLEKAKHHVTEEDIFLTRRMTQSFAQTANQEFSPALEAPAIESKSALSHVLSAVFSLSNNFLGMSLALLILYAIFLYCRGSKKCDLFRVPTLKADKRIWYTFINWKSTAYVFGWFLFQAVISVLPFGKLAAGPPVKQGEERPVYRLNGLCMLTLSLALFAALVYFDRWPMKLITVHHLPMITASYLVALMVAIMAYLHSFSSPSNGVIEDFMSGRCISPRMFGNILDLKTYAIKSGLIGWIIVNLWYFAKQWETLRFSNSSMLIVQVMQFIYVLDAMIFEEAILYTASISSDKFGFFHSMGAVSFFVFLCSCQTRYLYLYPVMLPWYCYILPIMLFASGYYIYRVSSLQKFNFRRDPHVAKLSGVDYISTRTGKDLLVDGWWARLRHPNYFGDLLMCVAFALPCGFRHFLPWIWPTSLLLMLVAMAFRDESKSKEKYGGAWDEYTERVKFKIIPFVC